MSSRSSIQQQIKLIIHGQVVRNWMHCRWQKSRMHHIEEGGKSQRAGYFQFRQQAGVGCRPPSVPGWHPRLSVGKTSRTRDRSPKICLVFVLFVVHPTRPSCISGQKSIKLETGTTATTRLARFHSKVIWKRVISPRTLICFLGVQWEANTSKIFLSSSSHNLVKHNFHTRRHLSSFLIG